MPEPLSQTARDVMATDVPTLPVDAAIADAVELLANEDIYCAVVLDEEGAPAGIITEGDLLGLAQRSGERSRSILRRLLQEEHHFFDTLRELRRTTAKRVGEAMTKPVESVEIDATIGRIAKLMESHDYRQVPVVDDGRLVGLVSRQDIIRAIADRS